MNWFSQSLLVGVGGLIGANLRYWIGGLVFAIWPNAYPWPTLLVNATGCFAIGMLMVWIARQGGNEPVRLFAAVGLLGGFTTMSAFSHETLSLLRSEHNANAIAYAMGSVGLCLVACWAGGALIGRAT